KMPRLEPSSCRALPQRVVAQDVDAALKLNRFIRAYWKRFMMCGCRQFDGGQNGERRNCDYFPHRLSWPVRARGVSLCEQRSEPLEPRGFGASRRRGHAGARKYRPGVRTFCTTDRGAHPAAPSKMSGTNREILGQR